ncbi:MAG TPA: M1 family metallopeptidase, partial [Chthoniobacterales bacterium]|nr:M1 family metallopeptidase [Chthoniobacterales bacterium]
IVALFALLLPLRLKAEAPFNFATTPGKLPKDVIPVSYDIQIKPKIESRTFTGSETVALEIRKPAKTITLNANAIAISSAKLLGPDGKGEQAAAIKIDTSQQTAVLTFPKEIAPGVYRLSLDFSGTINQSGQGLFYATYQEEGSGAKKTMLGTQMEATDARRLFPCWDEPVFRAKFRLTTTVPASFTAFSNMPVERETNTPEGKEVHFGETPPMPSYLVVFCAGELEALYGEADGVKIGVVTTKGKAETGRYALESAEKILHYFNEYFGIKYPLPKLDLIAVPGGFGGAMENWGGIVFYESVLLFDPARSSEETKESIFEVVAHEMAHQWFGDLVTMAWWDNLWLNEGFASWMGTKCSDHFNPQWKVWLRANAAKQRAMATDALSSTHPIQQPVKTESEADSAFDEITYQKGQSFLRMLESYLGEADFRAGIRSYMQAHKYSNSTTADLWIALGEASKKPVSALAASWTEQPGLPLVSVSAGKSGLTTSQERFTVHQKNPKPLEWKIPIAWRDVQADPSVASRVFLLETKSSALPDVQPGQVAKLNAGDIGYYRVVYDSAHFEKLLASVTQFPEADQVTLVSDTWALVQADRRPIADYFKLVEALRADDGLALWEQITTALSYIDFLYIGNKDRPAFQTYARSLLRPVFDRLGWDAKSGEEAARGLLRVNLITTLGDLADQGVIDTARERFHKFLADPQTLAPDLRPAVFGVVGRYADQKTWETLHELGLKTKSIEEKGRFYFAMSAALDPDLAKRTLPLSLTDELPASRAVGLVTSVSRSAEQPALAWEFAQAQRKQLEPKLDALGKVRFLANIMRGFSEANRATELEAYAQENLPSDAKSEISKAAEEIRFKADLKAHLFPEIATWIAKTLK